MRTREETVYRESTWQQEEETTDDSSFRVKKQAKQKVGTVYKTLNVTQAFHFLMKASAPMASTSRINSANSWPPIIQTHKHSGRHSTFKHSRNIFLPQRLRPEVIRSHVDWLQHTKCAENTHIFVGYCSWTATSSQFFMTDESTFSKKYLSMPVTVKESQEVALNYRVLCVFPDN